MGIGKLSLAPPMLGVAMKYRPETLSKTINPARFCPADSF